MRKITLSEYNSIPKDYRGIWTVERWDLPNWAEIREKHMGKRTMMVYDKGTCLLEERKHTARKLGEKAGTKMLVPMMMLLGIVMVIITVPALTSY